MHNSVAFCGTSCSCAMTAQREVGNGLQQSQEVLQSRMEDSRNSYVPCVQLEIRPYILQCLVVWRKTLLCNGISFTVPHYVWKPLWYNPTSLQQSANICMWIYATPQNSHKALEAVLHGQLRLAIAIAWLLNSFWQAGRIREAPGYVFIGKHEMITSAVSRLEDPGRSQHWCHHFVSCYGSVLHPHEFCLWWWWDWVKGSPEDL